MLRKNLSTSDELKLPGLLFVIFAIVVVFATLSLSEFPNLAAPVVWTLIIFLGGITSICSLIVFILRLVRRMEPSREDWHNTLSTRATLGLISCLLLTNGTLYYFCHTRICVGYFLVANILTPAMWFIGRYAATQRAAHKTGSPDNKS
jgi:DMSO/TMAO reductase YedYZ heme-binding membrane subunit